MIKVQFNKQPRGRYPAWGFAKSCSGSRKLYRSWAVFFFWVYSIVLINDRRF